MQDHSGIFRIVTMCRVLRVSRSGFYSWRHRQNHPSSRRVRKESLDRHVAAAFAIRKGRSGTLGLALDLQEQGEKYDRKTVAASMRRQGLRAKAAKKFKATTNSNHTLPVAPNLLQQDFNAASPNQKWVCDITYLCTTEGWLYLTVVIDLYSRLVVGWAMSERINAELTNQALLMALWRRRMPKGVILHSDRGSQYCSSVYQNLLSRHGLIYAT